jgi:selenium-binding protein 1
MALLVIAMTLVLTPAVAFAAKPMDKGFTRFLVLTLDGNDYYLAGAPEGPGGAQDVPGHYWVLAGHNQLIGKHYNTGPFGMPQGWSSDAPDGELLYVVHAIIDTWTPDKAMWYAKRGYVHYHELVLVGTGAGTPNSPVYHPTKVVWLRHTARTMFTLDRGPAFWNGIPTPPYTHAVTPGVDYVFPINGMNPYP